MGQGCSAIWGSFARSKVSVVALIPTKGVRLTLTACFSHQRDNCIGFTLGDELIARGATDCWDLPLTYWVEQRGDLLDQIWAWRVASFIPDSKRILIWLDNSDQGAEPILVELLRYEPYVGSQPSIDVQDINKPKHQCPILSEVFLNWWTLMQISIAAVDKSPCLRHECQFRYIA